MFSWIKSLRSYQMLVCFFNSQDEFDPFYKETVGTLYCNTLFILALL